MSIRFALLGLVCILGSGWALAQNYRLEPLYGAITLAAGFSPDPHVVSLSAGGSYDASTLEGNCRGYIANAPDYRLHYTAGTVLPLIISTRSSADTTLVINAPDGQWYCDDDSGEGFNASIRFNKTQSGQYDIWVGTYSASGPQSAELYISELHSQ